MLKKPRKRLLILAAFVLIFIMLSKGFRKLIANYMEFRKLKKEEIHLINENKKLQSKLRKIKDPSFIEYKARMELGLTRPDEIEYRFTPPNKNDENKAN